MNIFDFAMTMEEDGKAYYEKLARQTLHQGLKTIFTGLAQDEQKHYVIFRELKASGQAPAMQDSAIMDEARNVFDSLSNNTRPLQGMEDNLAAYQHAMKVEADSFRLYEQAAAEAKDPEIKQLLLRIAAEEHKHFNVLEKVYQFVNAPNQHLAWGEFSNLDEFRQFGRDVDD